MAFGLLIELHDLIAITLGNSLGPCFVIFADTLAVKRSGQAPCRSATRVLELSDFERRLHNYLPNLSFQIGK